MRWEDFRTSSNVEDRRGMGIPGGAGGLGMGTIIILGLVGWAFGGQSAQAEEARERARRAEREREERALLAVSEERTRIARELHDVIAHSVSVMGVQAAAAEELMEREPERARCGSSARRLHASARGRLCRLRPRRTRLQDRHDL